MIPKDIHTYYKFHSKFYDLTRWAFLFGRTSLKNFFPPLSEKPTILDIGCGTGKQLRTLKLHYPSATIIGIDQSNEMIKKALFKFGDSVELVHSSYQKDSFEQASFDLIICSYSLTMIENIQQTLSIIPHHLKPSGTLLIVDFDSSPFKWFIQWMKKNHVQMKPSLFEILNTFFPDSTIKTKKAYLGLYTYSVFKN